MPKITFDSDEEFTFDEDLDTKKSVETTHDTSDEHSDDDDAMPEAVSIRSSRDQASYQAKAVKEAALKLAKAEKEKRRLRDLQLKQQKQGSRRELKKQQQKSSTSSSGNTGSDSEDDEQGEGGADDKVDDSQRLPQDVLDAWTKSSPAASTMGSKRTHMTMADFEAVQAEYEAQMEEQLAAQRKKQKKAERGRMVGEYTVKVLNQRPKVAKSGKSLSNMVNSKLHRKANERENAIIQRSSGRFGSSAMVFRRPEATKKGKK